MNCFILVLLLLNVTSIQCQLLSYFLSGVPHIFKQLTDPLVSKVPPASPTVGASWTQALSPTNNHHLLQPHTVNGNEVGINHWLKENTDQAKQYPWSQPPVEEEEEEEVVVPTNEYIANVPAQQLVLPPQTPPSSLHDSAVAFPDYTDPAGFPPGFFDIANTDDLQLPVFSPPPDLLHVPKQDLNIISTPIVNEEAPILDRDEAYPDLYPISHEETDRSSSEEGYADVPNPGSTLSPFALEIQRNLKTQNTLHAENQEFYPVVLPTPTENNVRPRGQDQQPFGSPYLGGNSETISAVSPQESHQFLPNSGLISSDYEFSPNGNFPNFGSFGAAPQISSNLLPDERISDNVLQGDNVDAETENNNDETANFNVEDEGADLSPEARFVLKELDEIYAQTTAQNNDSHFNVQSSGLSISGSPLLAEAQTQTDRGAQPDFSRFQVTGKPFISTLLEGLSSGIKALIPNEQAKQAIAAAVASRQQLLANIASGAAGNLRSRVNYRGRLANRNRIPQKPTVNLAANLDSEATEAQADDLKAYPRRWQKRLLRSQRQKLRNVVRPTLVTSHQGIGPVPVLPQHQLLVLGQPQLPSSNPKITLQPVANSAPQDGTAGQLLKEPNFQRSQQLSDFEIPEEGVQSDAEQDLGSSDVHDTLTILGGEEKEEGSFDGYIESNPPIDATLFNQFLTPTGFHSKPRPPPLPFGQEPRSGLAQPILTDPSVEQIAQEEQPVFDGLAQPNNENTFTDGFELLEAAAVRDPVLEKLYRNNEELFRSNPNPPDKETTRFLYRELAELKDREPVNSGRIELVRPGFDGPFLEESDLEPPTHDYPLTYPPESPQAPQEISPDTASKILSLALAHFDQDAKHGPKLGNNNFFANPGPIIDQPAEDLYTPPAAPSNDSPDYPSFSALKDLLNNNPELASEEGLLFVDSANSFSRGREDLLEKLLADGPDEQETRIILDSDDSSQATQPPVAKSRLQRSQSITTSQLPRFRKGGSGRKDRLKWLNNLAGIVSPHHHHHSQEHTEQQPPQTLIRSKTRNYRTVRNI